MKCPECDELLKPWPWADGGYKGVICACGARWWSDAYASAILDATQKMIAELMTSMPFPADAITEGENTRREDAAFARMEKRDGGGNG